MSIDPSPAATRLALALGLLLSLSAAAQWGALDPTFTPGGGRNAGFDDDLFSVAVDPADRLLVTGFFLHHDSTPRAGVARLNSNGSLDSSFNPGLGAGTADNSSQMIDTSALQPDGKIILAGRFLTFDGLQQPYLTRLHPGGSVDNTFRPALNGIVVALALQPDGRLWIAGDFTAVNGVPRNRIARLRGDGSLDPGFDPGSGPDKSITCLALQPDGKVIAGGSFTRFNDVSRPRIVRLTDGGIVDGTFDPGAGPDRAVLSVALQPDGKVLLAGDFTSVAGVERVYVARLRETGSLDLGFTPGVALSLGGVLTVRPAPDGKVIIGGEFSAVDGTPRINLARLGSDGRLDPTFDPGSGPTGGVNPRIRCITLQADGRVVVGGGFTKFAGVNLNHIARLTGNQGGAIEFEADAFQVAESAGTATLLVRRTGSTNGTAVVGYAAVGGTALAGIDYLASAGTITFAPGETIRPLTVPILADALVEGDETVQLALGNPLGGYLLGARQTAQLTLLDSTSNPATPSIQSIQLSPTQVTLTWSASPGLSYQLQFRTNLTSAPWTTLPGDVTATGPTASKTDPAVRETERYYRVRQLP